MNTVVDLSVPYLMFSVMRYSLLMSSLDVRFNDRWHTFAPSAARGGQAIPMPADGAMWGWFAWANDLYGPATYVMYFSIFSYAWFLQLSPQKFR